MSEARTPSFLVRQARRYRRIVRRAHYELEGSLATRSRLTDKTFRAGIFRLNLAPRQGAPYGWVAFRFHLAVSPLVDALMPSEEVLDGLHLDISAIEGQRLFPLRRVAASCFESIAFVPPDVEQLAITGVALYDACIDRLEASLTELPRQEALVRTLLPHVPRALRQLHKVPRRVGRIRAALNQGGLVGLKAILSTQAQTSEEKYAAFYERFDKLNEADIKTISERTAQMVAPPKFSVVMPTYQTDPELLDEAIASVRNQLYPHWELCIADDASRSPHVRRHLESWAARDERIKFMVRETNGHISKASNSALKLAKNDWVVLLDHDDVLTQHALYLVAEEILAHPQARYIYSDEDKLDTEGQRCQPYFKPDFNYDLLLTQNYVTHLSVYRRDDLEAIGGFRSSFDGSQDYDLVLRIIERLKPEQIRHIPHVLYHWRILEGSAAGSADAKPYAYLAAEKALQEHLERKKTGAYVRATPIPGSFQVAWPMPQPAPKVSIIIPTRDKVDLLKRCVDSILSVTAYRPFDIVIVDNGSVEKRTHRFFENISLRDNVQVVHDPAPFNFSALINLGARHSDGSILALVNNDLEISQADWLSELVSHVARPDIGAVGPRLLYPNGSIQHFGVVLGLGAIAAHPFAGWPAQHDLYFGRGFVAHNVSAVTGACLLVTRKHFDAIGGMDEALPQAYNDVDFCLRLGDLGLRHLVTPHVTLFHHESASRLSRHDSPRQAGDIDERRAGFADEFQVMMERYGDRFHCDPYYNPNLTLSSPDYSLAKRPRRPYTFRQAVKPPESQAQTHRPSTASGARGAKPGPAHKTMANGATKRRMGRSPEAGNGTQASPGGGG